MKLNLGCGENHKEGYVNVDKLGSPDITHDLESFPWPWGDKSIDEIYMNHILEHLGETSDVYIKVIQELYRICKPGAIIQINVPHPRHDDFISDPTHVRAVMPLSLALFNQAENKRWVEGGYANSPLGIYHKVDFEIMNIVIVPDEPYRQDLIEKKVTSEEVSELMKYHNNVVKEIQITWKRV